MKTLDYQVRGYSAGGYCRSMMMLLLLLLLSTTVVITTAAESSSGGGGSDPNCPISCQNGSLCKQGEANFSKHPKSEDGNMLPFLQDKSDQGYYCDCPDGYTGLRCGRQYIECLPESNELLVCYNGGICNNDDNNNSCDCTMSTHNNKKYAGKYCEYEIQDNQYCDQDTKQIFCINGGICKSDYENQIDNPCMCPLGYHGTNCEFQDVIPGSGSSSTTTTTNNGGGGGGSPTTTVADTSDTCPFSCHHKDATCEQGSALFDGMPRKKDGVTALDFLQKTSQDNHYCACPSGYTGLKCGRPYETCSHYDHVCFHGGKCIDGLQHLIDDPKEYFCDCSNAIYDGKPYVGKYCESEKTNRCNNDGSIFCINHGTCNKDINLNDSTQVYEEPCICNDGYSGEHCQYENGEVPRCTINDCQNGGTCRLGIKSMMKSSSSSGYKDYWDNHDNYMFCDCPDGWYGNKCEIKGIQCGDIGICYNGGECMQGIDSDSGQAIYQCNCLPAATDKYSFAGKFCQSPSTSICTTNQKNQHNGQLFCTNKGICKNINDPTLSAHEGCDCPSGFHGPNCDLRNGETNRPCDLHCLNGGQCRLGAKDVSILDTIGVDPNDVDHLSQSYTNELMHCVCPDGFFGVQCETRLEVCYDGTLSNNNEDNETNGITPPDVGDIRQGNAILHLCLHNSKCVAHRNADYSMTHTCDCEASYGGIHGEKYAGKYCQFQSTDHCTVDGRPGKGNMKNAFCVNEGICKTSHGTINSKTHPGCTCPDGWEGDHCEYIHGTAPKGVNIGNGGGSHGSPAEEDSQDIDIIIPPDVTDRTSSSSNTVPEDTKDEKPLTGTSKIISIILGLLFVGGFVGFILPRAITKKEFDTQQQQQQAQQQQNSTTTIDSNSSQQEESLPTVELESSELDEENNNGEIVDLDDWNAVSIGGNKII